MKKVLASPYIFTFYNEWKLKPCRNDYNIVFDQTFNEEIDIDRLKNAINRFINSFFIFNSHLEYNGDNLYWIKNSLVNELIYFPEPLTSKQLAEFISAPFNLEEGPLYRFGLFKIGNRLRFISVLHHVLIDGASINFFINQLSEYYTNISYQYSIPYHQQEALINNLSVFLLKRIKPQLSHLIT